MKYEGGFNCDRNAKDILKNLIENKWFSSCSINYDTTNETDPYAPMDTVFTAITSTGKQRAYAIELKDRKGYSSEEFDDWMLETQKFNKMSDYTNSGYTVLYFNVFNDDTYLLWDYDSINTNKTEGIRYIKPHTQGDENESKVKRNRYFINKKYAIKSGNIYDTN